MQDFDKLESILKDYKRFMSESPHIDNSLPTHVHLAGFASDGLHINVHVCSSSVLQQVIHLESSAALALAIQPLCLQQGLLTFLSACNLGGIYLDAVYTLIVSWYEGVF